MDAVLQARENAEFSEHVSLAQGPVRPWTTDEEAEAYATDPRKYLMKRCEPFMKSVKLDTNNLLVATFYLPEFTTLKGADGKPIRFFVADKTTDEATWQGRVGLLIAKGPMCWVDDEKVHFGGSTHKIGDWVLFDRQDGRQISINRVHCRRLKDTDVWGATDNPMRAY